MNGQLTLSGEQGRMATLTGVYVLRYPAPAFQGRDSPH